MKSRALGHYVLEDSRQEVIEKAVQFFSKSSVGDYESGQRTFLINIARYLPIRQKESPNAKAVILPTNTRTEGRQNYISLTFQQLEWESNRLAIGLNKLGLKKGSKVLLMVPPGLDFVALELRII